MNRVLVRVDPMTHNYDSFLAQTRATAIYACTADQDDELSFDKGQRFYDVSTYAENDGWYKATM